MLLIANVNNQTTNTRQKITLSSKVLRNKVNFEQIW